MLKVCPDIVVDKEEAQLSEQALEDKGILYYLKNIDDSLKKSRLMYGFISKRSTGKIKYFQYRWFFLISSRPLNYVDYLNDPRVLDETQIPPLLELDTVYFFIMGKKGDTSGQCGEIKTIEIINITTKDMSKSKTENGHAMIVDTGHSLYH